MRDRVKKPCNCCGAVTIIGRRHAVCPVCFWENTTLDDDPNRPNFHNYQLTLEQAKKNYIAFGAFDRSALPYVRQPEPSEINNDTLFTEGYPADRRPNEWYREIAKDMKMKDFFIEISTSINSCGASCYAVENGVYRDDGSWMFDENGKYGFDAASTHNKYMKHFAQYMKHPGEHFFRYENGEFVEYRCFDGLEYNSGLYERYTDDVIFIREYGLKPARTEMMENIEKMMKKAERTRKSLLYACKYKNTELIKQLAPTAKPAQLNKTEAYTCTAIAFCAKNNDLEGFKAMAEAGADMTKTIATRNAVDWAEDSPDILKYIRDNYPDIFAKEVHKGFMSKYARTCTDRAVLEFYYEIGMSFEEAWSLAGGYTEPLLFVFVDGNNTAGVQFMYDKGFDLANIRQEAQDGGRSTIEEADRCGIKNEAYELVRSLIGLQKTNGGL